MTDIEIPEEHLGSDELLSPAPQNPELVETMLMALESANGLVLEFGSASEATRARFKFYNQRNILRKQSNHLFDSLIFSIQGTTMRITKFSLPTIREIEG